MELTRHLFYTTHKYVVLGKYTTDKLEKAFSKLRQGSGGTYFITVQQVLEKVNIQKTKLLLNCTSMENLHTELGHMCLQCSYRLDEQGSEVFDNLVQLETGLVYIAGYVTRKDEELPEKDLLDATTFYFEKYGSYTDELDRCQLNIPTDSACQWTCFCYIMFHTIKDNVCRESLSNILSTVAERYSFGMLLNHARILSNICINNYCRECCPRSSKENALKILKLSSADISFV